MVLNESNFNSLLNDEDVYVDEDVQEDEVLDNDPLGLADFKTKEEDDDQLEEKTEEKTEPEGEDKVDNFITTYLKENGIDDPSKIQFENEAGEIEEVDFNSLSEEEKLNILKDISNPGYTDYEVQVIDYLRRNNATLDDVIEYYSKKAVEDYLSEHPEDAHQRKYSIDDYSDDEVYLADLKSKYGDFSDEELNQRLESAKVNEELFNKEVAAIRANQKAIEEQELEQQKQAEEQSFQELQTNLQNAMANFNEIALDPEDTSADALSLEIADDDKAAMLDYLIKRDKDGKSQLVKDLEDPNALIELAYYRTRERDNITGLTRYWKNELANERKEKAKLQKELDRLKNKENNSSVVTPKNEQNTQPLGSKKTYKSVMDIYV